MSMTIVIDGLDEFKADVAKGNAEITNQLRWAMVQSTNVIKNSAQNFAPYKTGTLRRSIFTQVDNDGLQGIVGQDPNIARYGAAQEFGTIGMTINGRSKLGKRFSYIGNIPPHPYMRPAMQQNIQHVKDYFKQAIGNVVAIMAGK